MAKIKTSELIGAALDWAVSMCEIVDYVNKDTVYLARGGKTKNVGKKKTGPTYSTNWMHGGKVIKFEEISIANKPEEEANKQWVAWVDSMSGFKGEAVAYGPTKLVAAMRCHVKSAMGDVVDVPDELV